MISRQTELKNSADSALKWIKTKMMTDNNAERGIYERIRIDLNLRTDWVRPDCNAEFLTVLENYDKLFGVTSDEELKEHITEWLQFAQNKNGSYNFFVVDGVGFEEGRTYWQNDNGKVLQCLTYMYSETQDKRYFDMAVRLADFWLSVQNDKGLYFDGKEKEVSGYIYMSPCGIVWMAVGMYKTYFMTGDTKYLASGRKAIGYVAENLMKKGRILTAYETGGSEEWRPFSSEVVMTLLAFCEIYENYPSDKLKKNLDLLGDITLELQDESGAILNQLPKYEGTSLQEGNGLCDLVYTQGFALRALVKAYTATGEEKYFTAADKLADFLVKIQCRNENELWDGGWRGAYDVHKKSWSGRANQNNTIDEGGMYSVYTGWCATNILTGMLELYKIYNERQKA